jgi:hypothetical protein
MQNVIKEKEYCTMRLVNREKGKPGVEPKHPGGRMNKSKSINFNQMHLAIASVIEKREKKKVGEFLAEKLMQWDIEKNQGSITKKYVEKIIDNV